MSPTVLRANTAVTVTRTASAITLSRTELVIPAATGSVNVVNNVASGTVLGRVSPGSGDNEELTPTQVRTLINVEDGAQVNEVTQAELDARLSAANAADLTDGGATTLHTHTGLSPGGTAGGVLSGTYPNPGFAADMATQAELDAEAVLARNADNLVSGTVADTRIASTIARDTEVAAAVAAEATLARNADNLTSGTVADGRVASTIARDTEVASAISTSEAGQVRDGDTAGGVLAGTYPSPSFAADMATQAELDAHTGDTSGAHAASAIAFTPAGTIAATTVQAAIEEAASEGGGGPGVVTIGDEIVDATPETLLATDADGNLMDSRLADTDEGFLPGFFPPDGLPMQILGSVVAEHATAPRLIWLDLSGFGAPPVAGVLIDGSGQYGVVYDPTGGDPKTPFAVTGDRAKSVDGDGKYEIALGRSGLSGTFMFRVGDTVGDGSGEYLESDVPLNMAGMGTPRQIVGLAAGSDDLHAVNRQQMEAHVDSIVQTHEANYVIDGDAAGGVLSGTYPDPGFAADMATQAELDARLSAADATDLTDGGNTTLHTHDALVPKSLYDANTILKADSDNTPEALAVAASALIGRSPGVDSGELTDLTPAEVRTLLDVPTTGESVLDALYDANTILKADADNTPEALAVATSALIGRAPGVDSGEITDLTPAEVRTLLGLVIGTDVQAFKADATKRVLRFVIDGAGSAITTGAKKVYLSVPWDCTITKARLLADVSGAIVVDVWQDTYANFPPVDADSITASAPPTITASGVKSEDSTLTGWDVTLDEGSVLEINVDSCSSITRCYLDLFVSLT